MDRLGLGWRFVRQSNLWGFLKSWWMPSRHLQVVSIQSHGHPWLGIPKSLGVSTVHGHPWLGGFWGVALVGNFLTSKHCSAALGSGELWSEVQRLWWSWQGSWAPRDDPFWISPGFIHHHRCRKTKYNAEYHGGVSWTCLVGPCRNCPFRATLR